MSSQKEICGKSNCNVEPIAIIGIGCRFPGGVVDPESYWKLLIDRVDAITEVPQDRWSLDKYCHPDPNRPGRTYSNCGGFIKNIDSFDAQFFGISPREAAVMDPQQKLLLEVSWEAMEDGGHAPERLAGSNTGVYVGISNHDYYDIQLGLYNRDIINAYTHLGGHMSIASNRISYVFDLRGPSVTVDTACSSSLVAIHHACRSLWDEECDLALAGGVNILIKPEYHIGFSKATMISHRGRCHSFDSRADGYVRSEGAGIIVLKPYSKAISDQDPIYAVICGSTINQDGHTEGITVPNQSSQEFAILAACKKAGISSGEIQFVEAHGTGTKVGDPIEARALGTVIGKRRLPEAACIIGSVKSNIGHLEPASGVAGLVKTVLALKNRRIPANINFENANSEIPLEELNLRVITEDEDWPDNINGSPRLAGVNSFGFGGTNVHVLLSEAPDIPLIQVEKEKTIPGESPYLLSLSARSEFSLKTLAKKYKDFLIEEENKRFALSDICYSAVIRRSHHDHRMTVTARSRAKLIESLHAFITGENRTGLSLGSTVRDGTHKLVFVFSGMGQQWWAMGRMLLKEVPSYKQTIEECDNIFRQYSQWSILEELIQDEGQSRIHKTHISQPAIFTVQVGLADLWRKIGIVPDAVVGHSVGEVAAAYVAGVISLEDALKVVYHRSRLQAQKVGRGTMLSVGLSEEEVTKYLVGHEDEVSIAAINSQNSVTLSGKTEVLKEIFGVLEVKQVFCRFLQVELPYHSPVIDSLKIELAKSLENILSQKAMVPFYSTVTGRLITSKEITVKYWVQNMRRPVLFNSAIKELIESDHDIFLEIGAHPVLASYINESLNAAEKKGFILTSLRRKEDELLTILDTWGKLYNVGWPVDWTLLYPQGNFVHLPAYPWQREHYWNESEESKTDRLGYQGSPLLGKRGKHTQPLWETEIDLHRLSWLQDHRVHEQVVYPGAAYVEMALEAAKESFNEGVYELEDVEFNQVLFLDKSSSTILQTELNKEENTFTISSSGSKDSTWVQHARGRLNRLKEVQMPPDVDIQQLQHLYQVVISSEECYLRFEQMGLQYGSAFKCIEKVWCFNQEALVCISGPKALVDEEIVLHPSILDAGFQSLIAVLSANDKTYLPVRIGRIRFYSNSVVTHFWSHVHISKQTSQNVVGNIRLLDDEGRVLAEISELRLQALPKAESERTSNLFYRSSWQLKTRTSEPHTGNDLPSPKQISRLLEVEAVKLQVELQRERYYNEIKPQFDTLSIAYVFELFRDLEWKPKLQECFSTDFLAKRLGIIPQHCQLFERFLEMLKEEDILVNSDGQWEVVNIPDVKKSQMIWKDLLYHYPSYNAELLLLGRCGRNLSDVLLGKIDPLDIIFPQGSSVTLDHLYQDSPSSQIYNRITQKVIDTVISCLSEERTVRILEIGAGTGGLTAHVLPKLSKWSTKYVFTDISKNLTNQAEQKFRDYPFIEYQQLDIEKDPLDQGFEAHSIDLILAFDVLHATQDLKQTLTHIKKLLVSQGQLILLELTHQERWLDLIFGLLEGWWRFADTNLRPSHPILSSKKWRDLLTSVGFNDISGFTDTKNEEEAFQTLFLAQGPIGQIEPTINFSTNELNVKGHWLVFTDNKGIGVQLADIFREQGEIPILVFSDKLYKHVDINTFHIRLGHSEDTQRLIETIDSYATPFRGVIHLWSLDMPSIKKATLASLESAQSIVLFSIINLIKSLKQVKVAERLPIWLITQGVYAVGGISEVSIAQSPLCGLGRVIANEQQNLRTVLIDLSPECPYNEVQSLFAELYADDQEDEIVLRSRARYVNRLIPVSLGEIKRSSENNKFLNQKYNFDNKDHSFRLEVDSPVAIEKLKFIESNRHKPAPSEVEIEVYATALNFMDVAKAMGLLTEESFELGLFGMSLGAECAGKVKAIGKSVSHLQIGDDVIALAPHCFSTFVIADADLVVTKPANLSFEEAASIPIVFLTAYYAFYHLSQLQQGERVLIHAAAGGVGLAAIQIAQNIGAEIFATAGSTEKREFLQSLGVKHVMDSRSLNFVDEVMALTDGKGVDVVLNSLAREFISKSISVLATYGRFVDIGKWDIAQNRKLALRPFLNNLSFFFLACRPNDERSSQIYGKPS